MYNCRVRIEKTPRAPCNLSGGRVFWKQNRKANARDRVQRVQSTPPHSPQLSACPKTAPQTGILLRHFRKRGVVHAGARKRTLYRPFSSPDHRFISPCKTPQKPL